MLAESKADTLLLGGDLTIARHFSGTIAKIRMAFPGNVVLVAGNHDYYGSGIDDFREKLKEIDGVIAFEPGCQTEPLALGLGIYLCGSGGWGDARAGVGDASAMALSDEIFIPDLSSRRKLTVRLQQLGCVSARHLLRQFHKIPAQAKHVLILTHVPPWPEATWHEGHPLTAEALPRFCWLVGGNAISRFAKTRPETRVTVLCGHTHGGGIWKHRNIVCHKAVSCYGAALHNATITVGRGLRLRRLEHVEPCRQRSCILTRWRRRKSGLKQRNNEPGNLRRF